MTHILTNCNYIFRPRDENNAFGCLAVHFSYQIIIVNFILVRGYQGCVGVRFQLCLHIVRVS